MDKDKIDKMILNSMILENMRKNPDWKPTNQMVEETLEEIKKNSVN